MKIADSLRMFAGSVVIYTAVAAAYACTGDVAEQEATSSGGAGGSSGGFSAGPENGVGSGDVDSAAAGPVPPAMADPMPGSRLRSVYRTMSDGSRQWIAWYDPEIGANCYWIYLSGRTLTCAPRAISFGEIHADAACTIPVVRRGICDAQLGTTYAIKYDNQTSCYSEGRIHETAPLQVGTPLFIRSVDACLALNAASTSEDFLLGREVDAGTYVTAEDHVEP